MRPPRLLFVPVSGPAGAGEFYRALALARAVERRWPGGSITFVASRDAPYAAQAPYPVHLVERSPTLETGAVNALMERIHPDVVVFDNAGSAAQYRRARQLGARVIYLSSRRTTRRKGFRLRRMRWMDRHWIARPRFMAGDLTAGERVRLRLAPRCEIGYLDAMHEPLDEPATRELLERLGLERDGYVLVCPGGGGLFDHRPDAVRVFHAAAREIARTCGLPVVAVMGARFEATAGESTGLHVLGSLANGQLMGLLREARVAVINGGSLLLQALVQRTPCVAAPIAGDQPDAIAACVAQGFLRSARLDPASLAAAARELLSDAPGREDIRGRLEALDLRNGADIAVDAIERLLPAGVGRPHEPALRAPGRLRIMQIILSRGFAGSERAASEACNAMCVDHDVTLMVRRDHRSAGGTSIRDYLDPRVTVIELPARMFTRRRLAEAIEAIRPDVIHTHLRRGTRYVVQIGSGAVHVCTLHLSINGPHFLQSDGLFCISEWQVATVPPGYPGKVYLLPNSLVPQPKLTPERRRELRDGLGAGDDDFVVGAVGRLVHGKGFDVLLRAFEAAQLPRGRLVIVGDGTERGALRRLAGRRVHFTGFRRDAKDLYQAFDLFVSPSRSEPFGRVIVEALDGGVPVIATDALGPRDIARQFPIRIVPRDDVQALAAALRDAESQPRRRMDVDLAGFHVDRIAARMIEAYRELLALRAARTMSPRVLFAPVSGPHGSGELMRSLIIARELVRADPGMDVRFLVSRDAVFREAVEFPIMDCDASPTRSTHQVLPAIAAFRPDVMVFDNSGRTVQLRAARAIGSRLVFLSRAPRLRHKAFRVKWMRLLDEHWIVFPAFVTGGLTFIERLKLAAFPSYHLRYLDTVFRPSQAGERASCLAGLGLTGIPYTVFVPGGRGDRHDRADPSELFVAAARAFVERTGQFAVVLTGWKDCPGGEGTRLRLLPRLEPDEVQHLLAAAALVVSNGGTSMIHALSHARPVVAVAVASDQGRRIRRAVSNGVAVQAEARADAIATAAAELLGDQARQESMTGRIAALGIANGVDDAVASLRSLARRSAVRPPEA